MYRSSLIVVSVLVALMFAGGCAKKNPQAEAVVPEDPVATEIAKTEEPAAGQVEPVVVEPVALEASALKTIYFDYDSHGLSPVAEDNLKKNAAMLQTDRTLKVAIEGYCDERGSDEYNMSLGERRAREVMSSLVSLGIEKGRLSVVSYGEERPAAEGTSEESWAKNRRVEFR